MKKSACNNSIFLITLLIISFSSLLFAQNLKKCHPQDQIAINKIQTAFGLTPTPNCCDWSAVTCKNVAPFRVIDLFISNDSTISGQIPAAIGDLSSLQILQLQDVPNITGNIPPAITKLTKLFRLIVSGASLSGPIPTFLANLKNLITLDLSENALTGSIPPQLSQLTNLGLLDLSGNKLTGSIPESFGQLPKNMSFLFLSGNFLSGTIPKSLGNLNNLINLDLSQNSFKGDASFLFGKNKIISEMLLQSNKFRFDFSNVAFPPHLNILNMSRNHIFGSLPQQMTQLDLGFGTFDVSYNNLCGAIPQVGSLQTYGPDSYSHNKCLCGAPLPPCK